MGITLFFSRCLIAPAFLGFLLSCSGPEADEPGTEIPLVSYSSIELDVLQLINSYRVQEGMPEFILLDEVSSQADLHNEHMVVKDEVCHHFFGKRYKALVEGHGALAVSENVAFGYRTADAVVRAWVRSQGHRKNLKGNFTHFGISVKEGKSKKLYFTNIFIRK